MADPRELPESEGNWIGSQTSTFADPDSELWYAIAGKPAYKMPRVNHKAVYFVQGHADHSSKPVEIKKIKGIAEEIVCTVESVDYFTKKYTNEVFTRIKLVPVKPTDPNPDTEFGEWDAANVAENYLSPAPIKLFVSDSKAKDCRIYQPDGAKSIFLETPCNQEGVLDCYDVDGVVWKFKLVDEQGGALLLTDGWSEYLKEKQIKGGDIVMFWRDGNRVLRVGIHRMNEGRSLVSPESVVKAAGLANKGEPFEVVYYPRNDTPEFVVDAARVKASMNIPWAAGMKFKMPFKNEFYSNIRRHDGTVIELSAFDSNWSDSPWKCLKVKLDASSLYSSVTRVSPWMVEVVPNESSSKDSKNSPM